MFQGSRERRLAPDVESTAPARRRCSCVRVRPAAVGSSHGRYRLPRPRWVACRITRGSAQCISRGRRTGTPNRVRAAATALSLHSALFPFGTPPGATLEVRGLLTLRASRSSPSVGHVTARINSGFQTGALSVVGEQPIIIGLSLNDPVAVEQMRPGAKRLASVVDKAKMVHGSYLTRPLKLTGWQPGRSFIAALLAAPKAAVVPSIQAVAD
jgi:hypothetical protein